MKRLAMFIATFVLLPLAGVSLLVGVVMPSRVREA
jgi:hypothetical protein